MQEISSASEVKKRAKWYRPERYEWVKDASEWQILEELGVRWLAYNEMEKGNYKSVEIEQIFSGEIDLPVRNDNISISIKNKLEQATSKEEKIKLLLNLNYGVSPVTACDAMAITHPSRKKDQDVWSKDNIHDIEFPSNGDVWVNLPIEYMRDSDILAEVKKLLGAIRVVQEVPEPKDFYIAPRITRLKEGGIFEYLDLKLWLQINDIKISNKIFSILIEGMMNISDLYLPPKRKNAQKYDVADKYISELEITANPLCQTSCRA